MSKQKGSKNKKKIRWDYRDGGFASVPSGNCKICGGGTATKYSKKLKWSTAVRKQEVPRSVLGEMEKRMRGEGASTREEKGTGREWNKIVGKEG